MTMRGGKTVLGVILVVCITLCPHEASGQSKISNEASEEGPPTSGIPPEDSLENTVFSEMLRIVDSKFDSISARISVLERSINSLNFYSVRQFREITESLESSTETTERLRSQITKLDADDRALKAAVSQVGRDINGIKKDIGVINVGMNDVKSQSEAIMVTVKGFRGNSEKMLDDIATSVVYLNENTKRRMDGMKDALEGTVETRIDAVANQIEANKATVLRSIEQMDASSSRSSDGNTNCSVNFGPLEERLDKKFAEMKRQTQNHFLELLNLEEESGNDVRDSAPPTGLAQESQQPSSPNNDAIVHSPAEANRSEERWRSRETGRAGEGRGGGDGEKVMRMLANMTRNVMDAVTYFRHTGGMMERLIAATENVAREQNRLRYDILETGGLLIPSSEAGLHEELPGQHLSNESESLYDDDELDANAVSPDMDQAALSVSSDYAAAKSWSEGVKVRRPHAGRQQPQHANSSPGMGPRSRNNSGPNKENYLAVLAELTKNGTQLLDVLTDLAQLSSSSLTKAVGSLHEEVVRLEDVRARLNEGLLYPGGKASNPAGGQVSGLSPSGGDLVSLQNTTKTIFTIVEAIASNTGWIPYIFHNMQQVERQTNKTLELAKRSLLSVHMTRGLAGANLADPLHPGGGGKGEGGGDKTTPTQAEALEVIYDTNVQLLRILPALTRLVAEPEPLIALADGSSSTEGRAEVFYKGQWGSVCADSMGHEEAEALCRHLGHAGGIWAGEEHFERGSSGRYWQLNVTGCVEGQQPCPVWLASNTSVNCLSGHFAVICDHMLRLTPAPELYDDNADTGLLSLHHQGRWLPICGHGWSGYEARVACKQMGYQDGRELDGGVVSDWRQVVSNISSWVSGVGCTGQESRLDSCSVVSFQAQVCTDDAAPAAVRCQ